MLGKIHWRFLSKKFLHFPRKLKSPKNIFITIVSVCTLCVGLVYSNCGSQISEIGQNNFIHEAGVTDDASPNLHETPESTFKVGVPAKTGETAKADAGVVDGRSTEVKDPAGVKDPIACTNRNGSPCAIVVDTGQYFSRPAPMRLINPLLLANAACAEKSSVVHCDPAPISCTLSRRVSGAADTL